jgi:hypothetical protein
MFRSSFSTLYFFTLASLMGVACDSGDKTIGTSNRAPDSAFTLPLDGSEFDEGSVIEFYGVVGDDGPLENLDVTWVSSIDGVLPDFDPPDANGNVEMVTASLSEGTHVISLQVIDDYALQGESNIAITVIDVPEKPSIEILHPYSGELGLEDTPYVFMVEVSDRQEAAENLRVELSANPSGFVCFLSVDGTGLGQCSATLPLGTYTLTFSAEDSEGNVAESFATFSVVSQLDFDVDGDGYSPNGGDCNDSNQMIYPGAPEICDGLDNDCSDATPAEVNSECYDDDGDGYCEAPPCINATSVESDCDDFAPLTYPNAPEVVNANDDNCDGRIDEGTVVYDDDGDGYCETPPCINTTRQLSDCDDADFLVNPAATETCGSIVNGQLVLDGIDNDCDGNTNQQNANNCTDFYMDSDEDGFGVQGPTQCWCEPAYPYSSDNTNDCFDANSDSYPGASGYHQVHRGDGSFDFNCDFNEERQYETTYAGCSNWVALTSCNANSYGWNGAIPQCGQTGQYIQDCDAQVDYVYLAACGGIGYLTGNWSIILQCLQSGAGQCNPEYNTSLPKQPCR